MASPTPGNKPTTPAKQVNTPLINVKPTEILPDQTAFIATNLHPVILISILAYFFRQLVEDPVTTLIKIAPLIGLIQTVYCVLCLPSAGTPVPSSKPGPKKKAAKPAQDFGAKAVPAFLSLLLTLTLTAPALYLAVILFGAPLTTHNAHTVLLALHFALLTTPQLFYVYGLEWPVWIALGSMKMPLDEPYGMALGACAGAWFGAIPIPLDWDREWQKWPVTIIVGLYVGAVAGKMLGGYVVKGMRIKIS